MEESNPEYEKLKHYIFELEDHLAEAQKQAFRLVKRHKGSKSSIMALLVALHLIHLLLSAVF